MIGITNKPSLAGFRVFGFVGACGVVLSINKPLSHEKNCRYSLDQREWIDDDGTEVARQLCRPGVDDDGHDNDADQG